MVAARSNHECRHWQAASGRTQAARYDTASASDRVRRVLSLIRKLEQGERADTRLEPARRLAKVLRVPTTNLIADHEEEPDTAPGADDRWEAVRRALMAPVRADGATEEPTLGGVRDALESALRLFSGDRFAELSVILPPLLRDADLIAENGPEGRAVRVRLSQLTVWLLT